MKKALVLFVIGIFLLAGCNSDGYAEGYKLGWEDGYLKGYKDSIAETPQSISEIKPLIEPSLELEPTPPELTIPIMPTSVEPEPKRELETNPPHSGKVIIEGAIIVKGNLEPMILVDNPSATNPTYSKLKAFLLKDQTDAHDYLLDFTTLENDESYLCGDFAEALHNNAEAAGIRAGIVDFPDISHVANVFMTTDKGRIFIDSTGEFWLQAVTPPWMVSFGDATTLDKVAYFRMGEPLGFIEISVAELHGFTYPSYELWKQKRLEFERVLDLYPSGVTLGEAEELQKMAKDLGGFFEEEGIVYTYNIFWEGGTR